MTPALGYSKMKDSGIPWVGFIPDDWEIVRLQSQLFEVNENNNPVKTTQILSLTNKLGVIPYEDKGNQGNKSKEDLTGYKIAYPDCIVANSMNILIGSVGLSRYYGCVSPVYYVFKAKEDANINFLNYLFSLPSFQKELRKFANGILEIRLRVSAGNILKRKIALPPSKEQLAIVTYLDDQCAKIDEIIAEAKASIEDYKKWKASIIYEAVTKGLDPDVEMKESGISWIGKIPASWNMIKITRVLDYNHPYPIGDGDHGLIKATDYIEDGIPYIRVQNLGWGTDIQRENIVYISPERNEAIRNSTLRPNDILFAKTGATIGKTGIVPRDMTIANTTSHVGKITVSSDYNPKFIFYVLSSYVAYNQFWEIASSKTTRPELSIEESKSIKITMPSSKEEQNEISEYLDEKCAAFNEIIAEKQSLISDLESYKKSLIYEVVTGKRRVC